MFPLTEARGGALNINEFAAITIRMASPDRIKDWSHGEVKKPETINYRTLKPELEGLFCEKIFGSTKDWECYCGKFKSIRYRGVICDRCQVEVTHSKVRRERMGHIELVAPVSHIWYFKCIPTKMGVLLNMSQKDLDRVLYFQSYVVMDPKKVPGLKVKQLLTEEQHSDVVQKYGPNSIDAEMGAEAVLKLLNEIDLEKRAREIEEQLDLQTGKFSECSKQDLRLLRRELAVVDAFRKSGNKPEWMILKRLPVIPPELRPMVQLEGGRFATSDLNDLYRRVINRNNRLKRLLDLRAPGIIVRNEKRMLQEAVDALLDNGRRGRAVKGANNNRVLKSLSDMLKGKQGRFRQNLLGKRVDYSGRSVIVVGPELGLHQCGLPKKMALELFKPFIMRVLVNRGIATNIKAAKKMVEREAVEVWEVIEDVIADHPVLLNRAPTLHRLGIQAFQPVLVEGKAIRVHPLVCVAFNADFDGDQMAVHVPLSAEAIVEAKVLMSADRNILSPASGKPVITPTQDIVLGIYFLTKEKGSAAQVNRKFATEEECLYAMQTGVINLQGRISVRVARAGGKRIETTPGRLIFNQVLPPDYEYVNETLGKAKLSKLIEKIYTRYQESVTSVVADKIKRLGFTFSSGAGISIGIDDMRVPAQKEQLIAMGKDEVFKINEQFHKGVITEKERYTKIIDLWNSTTDEIARVMFEGIEMDREGFNPIFIMADSGARGSKQQIKQLAGMRGLMADPFGRIRETPITSNFREGMSVIEFFQSTTGSRKGLTDTALKTANAGYLTRRLVDVAQDVVITEEDCGTNEGVRVSHLKSGAEIAEAVHIRAYGRYLAADVIDELTGDSIPGLEAGKYIDAQASELIKNHDVSEVTVRSVLTCRSLRGVCRTCYGRDLANGRLVEIGEAVGVIAAQSIGEPGTQLTLRTFHVGGTASADDTYLRARFTGVVSRLPAIKKQADGTEYVIEEGAFRGRRLERYEVVSKLAVSHASSAGSQERVLLKQGLEVQVCVKDGEKVTADQDIIRVEVRVAEAGKVKSVKKESVVVSLGAKKDRRIDIPAEGLTVTVREGDKLEAGTAVAVRRFAAPSAGTVVVKAGKDGKQVIEVTAVAEENLSAVFEKGKLVESPAVIGSEPRIHAGSTVGIKDVIGVMPSFHPVMSTLTGRIEFQDVALQKEGNEQIVIQPAGSSAKIGVMATWRGSEHVVGPEQKLLVDPGQHVKIGDQVASAGSGQPAIVSPCEGTLELVRRYRTKDGSQVLVVRVLEKVERQPLPYLEYTKPSASTGKSKALTKAKKQNIKLIAKCHMVRHELFERWDKFHDSILAKVKSLRGNAASGDSGPVEFTMPSKDSLDQMLKYELSQIGHGEYLAHGGPDKHHAVCEAGELVVKIFSDQRSSKEGASEKSGMNKDITEGLPRVEELFELRKAKSTTALLSPIIGRIAAISSNTITLEAGKTEDGEDLYGDTCSAEEKCVKGRNDQYCRGCGSYFGAYAMQCNHCGPIRAKAERQVFCGRCGKVTAAKVVLPLTAGLTPIVDVGQYVVRGEVLTSGPVDPVSILYYRQPLRPYTSGKKGAFLESGWIEDAAIAVADHITKEVEQVYVMQGIDINYKHIEVIVRQMMRKIKIDDPGDSGFLPGELKERIVVWTRNQELLAAGKTPAVAKTELMGITKSAKNSDSFISAASFQETTWALTEAAVQGKRDDLRGLKEAVVIGHLIPAGTGLKKYREGVVPDSLPEDSESVAVEAEAPARMEVASSAS